MNTRLPCLILAACALSACGHNDSLAPAPAPTGPTTPTTPALSNGDTFALTVTNKLVSFNRDTPGTIRNSRTITGLQADENLLGIDFRPADGMLYAVSSTARIYTINTETGAATFKAALAADATDTTAPYSGLSGTDFGLDFNPVPDRLRLVSNTGQSLRINVDNGATTTDGAINGGTAGFAVSASAYTNSFAGTASTTLYAIDYTNDLLYVQNPPNNGTLGTPVTLGVDSSANSGFDIDARRNTGYAVFTVGGVRNLYTINLGATANAATLVGAMGDTDNLRGLALRTPPSPTVVGLTDDNRLVSFKPGTPNTIDATVAVSGLQAGETLLGIDVRPADGALYGLTSAGRIVTINPATGAATVKSTLVADGADMTAPFSAIAGTAFAVDFNPVADRLRVISDSGQSLRINVDTGATTTDGTVLRAGSLSRVTAAAYTNSFAGTTSTMLLDIDTEADVLALQSPPNDGTLSNVGALGVNVAGDAGFDIAGGANGMALAAFRTSATGPSSLYRIDLATGAATLVNGATAPAASVIGASLPGVRDIAILLPATNP